MSKTDPIKSDKETVPSASEAPTFPQVRHLKESDLSEEARQRIFRCLAAAPSPYRSNGSGPNGSGPNRGGRQVPHWKKAPPSDPKPKLTVDEPVVTTSANRTRDDA
ncbi:hypothetical protein FBZ89_117114 [Nitrospirillum amazonense]|uniref:Uncharacterized protein n=1 Tax=Nitrospirillum amazonense TaxID=28077 RepID=A0A560EXZ3_9PROT|nr:hypothetical protein [Nitrospirillum amazonense]TWB14248.1 hypothetical protein FBZ89_117114 [Nitrospirillum amazonense]